MDTKKIGNLISSLRKEKKLSQQALADLLRVSPKTISKWECGNGLPDICMLKKVSEVLNITIEELLDGNLSNKDKIKKESINKKRLLFIIIILSIFILILTVMFIIIDKNNDMKEVDNCTIIRTYYIDNIGKSNDQNYLYITLHEYQVEGTFTIKLPVLVSKNLEVGSSYEFTFKTNKEYLMTTTDKLFDNAEVINLEYSDKVGLERTSMYYCDKEEE